jgi:hypothetical protein
MIYTGLSAKAKPPCTIYVHLRKMKDRRVKQVFSGGWVPEGWGGHKEMVKEGECGGCILYLYVEIEE